MTALIIPDWSLGGLRATYHIFLSLSQQSVSEFDILGFDVLLAVPTRRWPGSSYAKRTGSGNRVKKPNQSPVDFHKIPGVIRPSGMSGGQSGGTGPFSGHMHIWKVGRIVEASHASSMFSRKDVWNSMISN